MTSMEDSIAKFAKRVLRMEKGLPPNQVHLHTLCTNSVSTVSWCMITGAMLLLLGDSSGLTQTLLSSNSL